MPGRIHIRRRLTSGNIKDPDLHRERITDIQMKRQAFWTMTLVVVGSIAFIAVVVAMQITS